MNQLAPIRLRVEKDIIVRIDRVLSGKGVLTVAVNQEVKPSDIIGSSSISTGFRVLNLATLLGVDHTEIEKYLKRNLGQRIYQGELLAFKDGGLFGGKKTVISPTDGILDYLNPETGEMRISLLQKKIDLPSGVYGRVESIDSKKGIVTLIAQASRIYGVFGCGKLRDGTLEILGKRDGLVTKSMITPKSDGHIIMGGSLIYKDAISDAISCGINGIITGGVNAKDYKSMSGGRLSFPKKLENDIGISIVVCEGFGSMSIGEDVYNLLSQYNHQFVLMDGNKGIIDLPSSQASSLALVRSIKLSPISINYNSDDLGQLTQLKIGFKCRVIGSSYSGEQGTIIAIDASPTLLPSGISCFLATIETRRRKIKIPVVNLEVIDYIK